MARKTTLEEFKDRLKEYRAFLVEVDFIAYKSAICVLAADYLDCQAKLAERYPGITATITSQLTAVIV